MIYWGCPASISLATAGLHPKFFVYYFLKCNFILSMSQSTELGDHSIRDEVVSDAKGVPTFQYHMTDMKAMKIAALVKFAQLPYNLDEVAQDLSCPYTLHTSQGDLVKQNQIISYIINDHLARAIQSGATPPFSESSPVLFIDIFSWSKMTERLIQFRSTLFAMLQEFYCYLLGHASVKRSKYDMLNNKIRKEIHKIDQEIAEHSQIYGLDLSLINIVLACELFLGYKFVFEDKFRKNKHRIFTKCEKIYKTQIFQEIYGKKVTPCTKECLPAEFQQEQDQELQTKKEQAIQIELAKLVDPWISASGNQMRNQLLFNFFKNTFKSQESKRSYFPFFWMTYDSLMCNLVELKYEPAQYKESYTEMKQTLTNSSRQLAKLFKTSNDYGFLGLYFNEKEHESTIKGLVVLGDYSFNDFVLELSRTPALRAFVPLEIDVTTEEERLRVQQLWQCQYSDQYSSHRLEICRQF